MIQMMSIYCCRPSLISLMTATFYCTSDVSVSSQDPSSLVSHTVHDLCANSNLHSFYTQHRIIYWCDVSYYFQIDSWFLVNTGTAHSDAVVRYYIYCNYFLTSVQVLWLGEIFTTAYRELLVPPAPSKSSTGRCKKRATADFVSGPMSSPSCRRARRLGSKQP